MNNLNMPKRGTITVSVSVPTNYILPEFYETASPDAIAEALRIGATLYETLKDMKAEEGNAALADLETKKQTEINRIREQSSLRLNELLTQLANADESYAILQKQHTERMTAALTQERTTLKTTYEAQVQRHQEIIASLQHRVQLANESRDTDIQKAEERTKAALALAIEEKQRTIERQQRDNDKLANLLERNSEELNRLSQNLLAKKLQNSKAKGEEFEAMFKEKLIQAYGTGPNFSIEETSKNGFGHQADHIMNWDGKKILWEVKNYDRPVPTTEVEKFHRDMKENDTISIGVMVSRYTHITGKNNSGNKHIEFTNNTMLIYLNNFDTMSEDTLPGLMLLFKIYWHASRNFDSQETIEDAVRTIEKLHTDSIKAKTEWKLHKSHNDALVRWAAELVEKTEECLGSTLRNLQGGITKEKINIPKHIFRDVSGEEKSVECIRHILDSTTVDKNSYCVLNDLADIVSKKMNLTRETIKDRIKGILLDDAYVPSKGKNPARITGLQINSSLSIV